MTARLPDMWPGLMRVLPQSKPTTHVTIRDVEFEAQYEYTEDTVVLVHAYVTEDRGPAHGCIAVGQDLADWLNASQRAEIQQAILLQIERSEQSARFAAQAAF